MTGGQRQATMGGKIRRILGTALAAAIVVMGAAAAERAARAADRPFIVVASTTSTEQSGLFGYLLPIFTARSGIEVRVVAVGTGQALKIGERGDADVVFVHDKPSELKFVADGWGVGRREVMYNDFVLIGPKSDPAKVAGGRDIVAAFKRIADAKTHFVSRGDDSGTDKAEKRLWADAAVDVKAVSGSWYFETGAGMGPTLNTAAAMDSYTLSDRGTWLSFENRRDLEIVVEGDRHLFNQYGVMLVNPARHPGVKKEPGTAFIEWLTSAEGQTAIAGYKINGEQLFFPNYAKPQM
jgi:tungstate transport system substrate-binding protein